LEPNLILFIKIVHLNNLRTSWYSMKICQSISLIVKGCSDIKLAVLWTIILSICFPGILSWLIIDLKIIKNLYL
jgi:hypothetical protein